MTQCPCQWNIKLPLIINRVSYFSFRSRLVERPQHTLSSLCEMQWRGREEYVLHCWRELYPMPYNELWSKGSKRGVLYLQMFWKLTREQSNVFLKNDLRSSWCFGQMTVYILMFLANDCVNPDVFGKWLCTSWCFGKITCENKCLFIHMLGFYWIKPDVS